MRSKKKKIKISEHETLSPEQEENLRLQHKIQGLREVIREQKSSTRYWEKEADRIQKEFDVAMALQNHENPIVIKPKKGKTKSETTPILVWSDWHVEETVDGATINEMNEYNLDIADERITRLVERSLEMIELWRGQENTTIDRIVLALLGDFITGYIHEELEENNSLSPTEAVLWVQKRLIASIQYLLDHGNFKEILIPCCIGNHGRTTKKPRVSSAYKNNYEWLMYHTMAQFFEMKGEKRVKFKVENSHHNYCEIFGRTVRFHHGDYFNSREGIGGISVPVNKAVLKWNKSRNAWLDVFGHWHQSLDGGSWVCNSSLIGFNPFAVKIKAAFEPPSQTIIMIEKNRGKTAVLPVWVAK